MPGPPPAPDRESLPAALSPALDDLGVRLHDTGDGGTLRVYSGAAEEVALVVFDDDDLDWAVETVPLSPVGGGVWRGDSALLRPGARYALRADGPPARFNRETLLLDPYARGIVSGGTYDVRGAVVDDSYDHDGIAKPRIPADRRVIYEGHVKGLTKRHPDIPPALHGTYAGLAHPAFVDHLTRLGITSLQLLPIHAFVSEPRLVHLGLANYWGYNTLGFFAPHAPYATAEARRAGPDAVLREVKDAVRTLHGAGIEVFLDVVYNHTAEEGPGGPQLSLRGLDDRAYYRQLDDGTYVDQTGCGNTLDTANAPGARLVLDSLRYWANDVGIDGFRFDLAVSLGRDEAHTFRPDHPLLRAIRTDPELAGTALIAEPWDVGMGGWHTGGFEPGWHEWNDRYRDRVRNFWLSDIDYARRAGVAPVGIGGFATRLAGSSNTFSPERGPLASVNFVTAHDGFTLHDLVSYDVKHNLGNGEHNRDGADMNRSFNHGAEGPSDEPGIVETRRKAMRNLLGTLLLSAGIPMMTAGDEVGRTQRGNNNAYCQDSTVTWLPWELEPWQEDLRAHVAALLRARAENPALRPSRFAEVGARVPNASLMAWYDERGETMSDEAWTDPARRTLQYVAQSTPDREGASRILLAIHGYESHIDARLPALDGATRFVPLWSSYDARPQPAGEPLAPGAIVPLPGTGMRLFRVE